MTTSPDPSVHPDLLQLREAAGCDEDALRWVASRLGPWIARLLEEGEARWGRLGLAPSAAARAIARTLAATWTADAVPTEPYDLDQGMRDLVLADLYLAEALVQGIPGAWRRFEAVIEEAQRSVRLHFAPRGARGVVDEIRDSVLGTFYIDRKIATYRASAPIGAWARQVIFNIFRQAINARRAGREAVAWSQIGDETAPDAMPEARGRAPAPHEILAEAEWEQALSGLVPRILATLEPRERRMLEVLPTRRMTQVELCREFGISPFKLNRWYKELRARFVRELAQALRWRLGVDAAEVDALMAFAAGLTNRVAPEGPDLPQDPHSGPSPGRVSSIVPWGRTVAGSEG